MRSHSTCCGTNSQTPRRKYVQWLGGGGPAATSPHTNCDAKYAFSMRQDSGVLKSRAFRIGLKAMPPEIAARVNDYPTASFYHKVRAAVEEAQDRGMFVDLTLGSGWPFGGGEAITPELASIELRFTHKSISGPSHFRERIALPAPRQTASMNLARMSGSLSTELPRGWRERLQARTRIVG